MYKNPENGIFIAKICRVIHITHRFIHNLWMVLVDNEWLSTEIVDNSVDK